MKLTVLDKEKYIKSCDVKNLPITYEDCKNYFLFNNRVTVYDDIWMHHLHLKITDRCNAACDFCIEKHCKINEDADVYLNNLDKVLTEMERAGLLYSVSVTGGEPTLFNKFTELCALLSKHKIGFLTMNTNGTLLEKYLNDIDGLFDFINISRHSIDNQENNDIFKTKVKSISELKKIKSEFKHTKMRIQCVMNNGFTIDDMNNFIKVYEFADDISFRRLMETSEEYSLDYYVDKDNYNQCLKYAFKNWRFVEQTIQDYYVYEVYENEYTKVTFSYSNMKLLREVEKAESEDFFREFILHPDGTFSGSWMKDKKIIQCGCYR